MDSPNSPCSDQALLVPVPPLKCCSIIHLFRTHRDLTPFLLVHTLVSRVDSTSLPDGWCHSYHHVLQPTQPFLSRSPIISVLVRLVRKARGGTNITQVQLGISHSPNPLLIRDINTPTEILVRNHSFPHPHKLWSTDSTQTDRVTGAPARSLLL